MERVKIWFSSRPTFWKARSLLNKIGFYKERIFYRGNSTLGSSKSNARIVSSLTKIGFNSLLGVALTLSIFVYLDEIHSDGIPLFPMLSKKDEVFIIEQLRLYAQILTAIFSIYFATIGIILSGGYTKLRRDIIFMLTNEQVGSIYSRLLVFAASFCLAATFLPIFGYDAGIFVYLVGTVLTLLSTLTLFPLGQRLFNFFDLNLLVTSELLPKCARHLNGVSNQKSSDSLSNYHSSEVKNKLNQLAYIDSRVKSDVENLKENLPKMTMSYSRLLRLYLHNKHSIDQESSWFPKRLAHSRWFFADDSVTQMALQTSSQEPLMKEVTDHGWFEKECVDKLLGHIELAFHSDNLELALALMSRFSDRIPVYTSQFQFDEGFDEVIRMKAIIENALSILDKKTETDIEEKIIGVADTWAAMGSNFCLETLRRMITFEKDLQIFFDNDVWTKSSLSNLPSFLNMKLAFIADRIEFENKIEGKRLSKPKYVQQLSVQKLMQYYADIFPKICDYYCRDLPEFVELLATKKLTTSATQVALASLHNYWKLPRWFLDINQLFERYYKYEHYTEENYKIPRIDSEELNAKIETARDNAIYKLSNSTFVEHIFEPQQTDKLPDHFGQIYFELAEACIEALEHNDESKFKIVLPMFMTLAFIAADVRFTDPSLDVNNEFRLHLVSSVINDLASVLGFSILYGSYFQNENLTKIGLSHFETMIARTDNKKQYLKRLLIISNPLEFSFSASPRGLIRINWKMSFEARIRKDGFGDQMDFDGKPHPNKVINQFLNSMADASHLFFAHHVLPQFEKLDFKINHHITSLANRIEKTAKD